MSKTQDFVIFCSKIIGAWSIRDFKFISSLAVYSLMDNIKSYIKMQIYTIKLFCYQTGSIPVTVNFQMLEKLVR